MELSKDYIQKLAEELNAILDHHNVTRTSDLDSMVGRNVRARSGESVSFHVTPSNGGHMAYTVSCHMDGVGIPIELKFNVALGYSAIILKSEHMFDGYSPFAYTPKGIAQVKRLGSHEMSKARDEISKLYSPK